ncbi:MAG: ATPase [Candidatus Marinimicrobia bacterium CG1_02_48_14]|nr:MAG: ATPase [Candidatus Marinimicrobia bacterium CG1_02_48_14]PIZ68408.1 MAG: ATPase [Candidatus Marinimicrobia bacterium CG_4_10_14_0_2_um_filter_48_9]
MVFDLAQINEEIQRKSQFVELIESEISKVIVGQKYLIRRLLVGLLANGHILLEGVPGLAKTLAVRSLATLIKTNFQRIQFTPDLLPADLLGTLIYNQKTGDFLIKKGPLFSNIILADEINRAPAKVQAALLEAMQERQITIGEESFKLNDPFLVLATQNPIEQEGTYPLPEAQVDRFMLKVKINYPNEADELEIIKRMAHPKPLVELHPVITPEQILEAREVVDHIYMDEKIERYIVSLVFATRTPGKYGLGELTDLIQFGASPRASINLALAAKAHAFINHRGYVTPDDIRAIGMDILRHRVLVTYEAEAENMTSEDIVTRVFETIEVP